MGWGVGGWGLLHYIFREEAYLGIQICFLILSVVTKLTFQQVLPILSGIWIFSFTTDLPDNSF